MQKIAKDSSLGLFPRGFSGEQTYWTLVGVDGGHESGLIGEDGAIEVARGGFSITPFVIDGERLGNTRSSEFFAYSCGTDYRLGSLNSWAHLDIKQNLDEGYLPMPSVKWTVDGSSKSSLGVPGYRAIGTAR
ncbi:MAG: hypothetical protein IPP82_08575 [Xanthomonadales bacterium]|nr:hypothetical protein [Xanthomonadales bacterium]